MPAVKKILFALSRYGLAALFLFAVGAKLYSLTQPTQSLLTNLPSLVGAKLALPVFVAVIVAELAVAILLLVPRTVRWGGFGAAFLLLGFASYALFYVYVLHGESLECGCFGGIIASQLGVTTALRNLVLLLPALFVAFYRPSRPAV